MDVYMSTADKIMKILALSQKVVFVLGIGAALTGIIGAFACMLWLIAEALRLIQTSIAEMFQVLSGSPSLLFLFGITLFFLSVMFVTWLGKKTLLYVRDSAKEVWNA